MVVDTVAQYLAGLLMCADTELLVEWYSVELLMDIADMAVVNYALKLLVLVNVDENAAKNSAELLFVADIVVNRSLSVVSGDEIVVE